MKKFLFLLVLSSGLFAQSHTVNGWKLPLQGYSKDSTPNWSVLYDSLMSFYAARNSKDGTCSLTSVLTIAGTTPAREFLLKLKGLGSQDAGILLTPSLHTSSFIDFEPDSGVATGRRGRIGRNPYNQGAALFVGVGGHLGNAFQIGQRDVAPVQLFTGDACRLMIAGNGNVGVALDTAKYDSLENHHTQSLVVGGGGIRSYNGYYDASNNLMVSSQWTTGTGSVSFAGNAYLTGSANSFQLADGNVMLYGDASQGIFGTVGNDPMIIRTNNIGRIYIEPSGDVTIYQKAYLSGVAALNYADSSAARTAGVATNQLYHTNGVLKIMY
jgi:hypothetical protein